MKTIANNLTFLIAGCGSIGKRHIRNLMALGYETIVCYDTNPDMLKLPRNELNVEVSSDFEQSLNQVDAVFICTPNHLHAEFIQKSLKSKKHIFVEKPIADTTEALTDILPLLTNSKQIIQVGCNLRFHPILVETKKLLIKQKIGMVYHAMIEYGSYLPAWRPNQDYTQNYGAHKAMGGGIILDDIHEIDYAMWLFGQVKTVFCQAQKISNLKIDTEDTADILLKTINNIPIAIHMDYLQRYPSRKFKIIGSDGIICGDIFDNSLKIYCDGKWNCTHTPYDYNQTYIDEVTEFCNSIATRTLPQVGFTEGFQVLNLACAAKLSAETHTVISL